MKLILQYYKVGSIWFANSCFHNTIEPAIFELRSKSIMEELITCIELFWHKNPEHLCAAGEKSCNAGKNHCVRAIAQKRFSHQQNKFSLL